LRRLRHDLAFRQNAAADANDRIGSNNIGIRKFWPARSDPRGGSRFFRGQARCEIARQLKLARGFVEIDRKKSVRLDANLLQEFEPPR
jgi:hypothetical protein